MVNQMFSLYNYQIKRLSSPMKLSRIVQKQIRMKHLHQGIQHTQKRNKCRSYKLKENYHKPDPHHDRLFIYSNTFGNEFIFKKQHFDAVEFEDPIAAYHLIVDLYQEINQLINKLWLKSMTYSKEDYFPINKKLVIYSTLIIWVITFMLCIALRFETMEPFHEIVQWSILLIVLATIVANLLLFVNTNREKYIFFEYDKEVVKLISRKLIENKEKFLKQGIQIVCDKQITWLCFKANLSSRSMRKQSQLSPNRQRMQSNVRMQEV